MGVDLDRSDSWHDLPHLLCHRNHQDRQVCPVSSLKLQWNTTGTRPIQYVFNGLGGGGGGVTRAIGAVST